MDINTLAAWGEFIGGIAVVVSLVYLALQIRQNSKLLRASTASATIAAFNATAGLMAQDPEAARIYWDAMADRAALSESDRRQFDAMMGMNFNQWNQEHQLATDGVIAQAVWESRTRAMRRFLKEQGMRQWWGEWRDMYADDFCCFVDGLIREGV
jgi:hypothetical protein